METEGYFRKEQKVSSGTEGLFQSFNFYIFFFFCPPKKEIYSQLKKIANETEFETEFDALNIILQ